MMGIQAVKFRLAGEAACFRKPDVNEKVYFTYNNIHRVALLGLLGAILGLSGYRNSTLFNKQPRRFPEFYEKLSGLKVAVRPETERGYFTKKVQYFNNSVGYASHEEGGNLMVFEQWLENPAWAIYLMQGEVEAGLWERLINYLTGHQCVYVPYLGKNDFPAAITQVALCELQPYEASGPAFIHSLFRGELNAIDDMETDEDAPAYIFSEYAPIALRPEHNFYIFDHFFYTNCAVQKTDGELFIDGDLVLSFFSYRAD